MQRRITPMAIGCRIAQDLGTHWESVRGVIHRYGIGSRWRRVWAKAPQRTSPEFWRWMGYFIAEGYACT